MLCCIGDLHLDSLSKLIPSFNERLLKTLDESIKLARIKGCNDFILMGDVFHTPDPSVDGIVMLLKLVTNYKDCTFYFMMGNHDYSNVNKHSLVTIKAVSQLFSEANVVVVDAPTYKKFGDTKVFICPHPYVQTAEKKVHWSLGHFAVNGAKSDNGFSVRTKNAPKGRWILGDFHTPQNVKAAGFYSYVGSLTQLGFQEKNNKRIILLDGKETKSIKVPQQYELINYDVKTEKDFKKLPKDKNVFIRIIVSSEVDIPTNFMVKNPRVIRMKVVSKRKDKAARVLVDNLVKETPIVRLRTYFENKKYEENVTVRALEIAESLLK